MEKKHILALLIGIWSLVNSAFSASESQGNVNLEDMKAPEEVSTETPRKHNNPFRAQDEILKREFNTKQTEDVFRVDRNKVFKDPDPWDD